MKTITPDNYLIRPFLTHKTQELNYVYLSGGNPDQVSIDLAQVPPAVRPWVWNAVNELQNENGLYARTLYASVMHMFYHTSASASTGSNIDLRFTPEGSNFYVVNMAQQAYGETVRAGSFRMLAGVSTCSLYDDGRGRIISTDAPTQVIGNIFYGVGIAVIQAATGSHTASVVSSNGLYLTTGSAVEVEFDASHTIYEHQVLCTIDPGEFNYSMNPSIRRDGTTEIIDRFASGTLTPYMTTVGLYTDLGELVAIAKFPRALKRATDSQQTVIFRLDI